MAFFRKQGEGLSKRSKPLQVRANLRTRSHWLRGNPSITLVDCNQVMKHLMFSPVIVPHCERCDTERQLHIQPPLEFAGGHRQVHQRCPRQDKHRRQEIQRENAPTCTRVAWAAHPMTHSPFVIATNEPSKGA